MYLLSVHGAAPGTLAIIANNDRSPSAGPRPRWHQAGRLRSDPPDTPVPVVARPPAIGLVGRCTGRWCRHSPGGDRPIRAGCSTRPWRGSLRHGPGRRACSPRRRSSRGPGSGACGWWWRSRVVPFGGVRWSATQAQASASVGCPGPTGRPSRVFGAHVGQFGPASHGTRPCEVRRRLRRLRSRNRVRRTPADVRIRLSGFGATVPPPRHRCRRRCVGSLRPRERRLARVRPADAR